jgi:hypothetical protein
MGPHYRVADLDLYHNFPRPKKQTKPMAMKKIVLLILLTGCVATKPAAVRPYIITEKVIIYTERNIAEYKFVDANGRIFMFYDHDNYYQKGDTIK